MPSRDPGQRFSDIAESIDRIDQFTKGFDAKTLADNDQVIFAVKYALMTVREATTKLGDAAADIRPDIPWREIRGLGNRLRHDYDSRDVRPESGC